MGAAAELAVSVVNPRLATRIWLAGDYLTGQPEMLGT